MLTRLFAPEDSQHKIMIGKVNNWRYFNHKLISLIVDEIKIYFCNNFFNP